MSGGRLRRWLQGGVLAVLAGSAVASHDWFGVDLCRTQPGRMPPRLEAADLPDPASTGAKLLAQYCAQCHNLPHPGMHTAAEWPALTRSMIQLSEVTARFAGRPGLRIPSTPERQQIDAYLAEQALRPLPPDTPAPAVYMEVCGDCHAAPDPALYPSSAWPAVFARMAGHRVSMARARLDPLDATRVLGYLSEHAAPETDPPVGGPGFGRWLALAPVLALALFALWRVFAGLHRHVQAATHRRGRAA